MREALTALARNPSLLQGFGIERQTLRDRLWYEWFAVQGAGKATLRTLRSFGDASGEEIGEFETQLPNGAVEDLLRAVEATLDGGPQAALSPGDVRVLVSLVACGSRLDRIIGGGPEELMPYKPLLLALDRAAAETRTKAKATLKIDIAVASRITPGLQVLPVTLSFHNRGNEGVWIRNPCAPTSDVPTEHVRFWYAERPQHQPGVTDLPVEPLSLDLEPIVVAERPLLWLGAGETEERAFSAHIELDPGPYLVRASFSSYVGGDTVAGQNLLRGCAFSAEHTVEVPG